MKKGQYLKVRSNCPLLFATTEVGQKVFRHFDPFLHILRQKLAILTTLEFQGYFFMYENPKNTLSTHSRMVGGNVKKMGFEFITLENFGVF